MFLDRDLVMDQFGDLDLFLESSGSGKVYADGLLQFMSRLEEDVEGGSEESNGLCM